MKTLANPHAILTTVLLSFIVLIGPANHIMAQCEIENGDFESWTYDTLEIQNINDTFDYPWEVPSPSLFQSQQTGSTTVWVPIWDLFGLIFSGDTSILKIQKTTDSHSGDFAVLIPLDTATEWNQLQYGQACNSVGQAVRCYVKFEGTADDTVQVLVSATDSNLAGNSSYQYAGGPTSNFSDSIIYMADTTIVGQGANPSYVELVLPLDQVGQGNVTNFNITLHAYQSSGAPAFAYFDDFTILETCVPASPPTPDSLALADIESECPIESPEAPTATDDCGNTIVGVPDVSFPITNEGTTTITWTYTDSLGNSSSQSHSAVYNKPNDSIAVTSALFSGVTIVALGNGYLYQWFECDDGLTPISGAHSQSYVAQSNGSYAVGLNNEVCEVISECIDVTTVGVDQTNEINLRIFPNPTSAYINISRSSDNVSTLSIFDVQGQLVQTSTLSAKIETIDLSRLQSGLYYLQIEGDERYHQHVVKF